MQASPLADYYKIAPIEDVPVCLRKSFTNILLVKNKNKHVFPQEIRYLQSKAGNPIPSHVFMKWKKPQRLLMRIWFIIFQSMEVTPIKLHSRPYKSLSQFYVKALGRSGQITLSDNKNRPRDVSAEETLRIYEEFYQMLPNRLVFCQHFTLRKPKK